jgi:hypothetical protein
MSRTIHGKIHGRTIQLDEDPQLADGIDVEVHLRAVATNPRNPSQGAPRLDRTRANDSDWDAVMEEIYQARKIEHGSAFRTRGDQ